MRRSIERCVPTRGRLCEELGPRFAPQRCDAVPGREAATARPAMSVWESTPEASGAALPSRSSVAPRSSVDSIAASSSASLSSHAGGPRGEIRERVLVRVYDLGTTALTRGYNSLTKNYGAFHTGVQVYGREWSFGMTEDDRSTGITWCVPCQNRDHSFRETLSMGYTQCSPEQVMRILQSMKHDWLGCTYNVLARNCHNFSDEFCNKLGVSRLPDWVNELAGAGHQAVEFLDSTDTGYDGGSTLSSLFGGLFASPVEEPSKLQRPRDRRQGSKARLCVW